MVTPNIVIEIKNRYENMNPSRKQISDYIISNYKEASYLRIHDLAKKSGVSASSVTGFVKELGYKNYKAFQLDLAIFVNQSEEENKQNPFNYGDISKNDNMEEVCQKVFKTNIQMLTDTLSIIDVEKMQEVSEHILKARRVILFGVGRSYIPAESGKNRFNRIGISAFCYRDPHEQVVTASMCKEGDLVIAISNFGRSQSVINATKIASKQGAITVGITSAKNSPLTNIVDYTFFSVSANSNQKTTPFEPSSENMVQIALLECLYMFVAIKSGNKIVEKYLDATKHLECERV